MNNNFKEARPLSLSWRGKVSSNFNPSAGMKKDPFNHLLALIFQLTGFEARAYRESTLKRRLELRLRATGCRNIQEYIAYLRRYPEEAFIFKENLLIHVTRFWRDRPVFTYFERHLLPQWLDHLVAQKRRRLRIWSVGCASGQEPFTLAMILHQPAKKRGLQFHILATDISSQILAKGREALYAQRELSYVPPSYRQIYFSEVKPGLFQVCPEIRKLVSFCQLDLFKEKGPGLFDLIVCRNLLIFFKPEAQSLLINKIIHSLKKDGLLLLGRAERINPNGSLELVSSRFCFYRKITAPKKKLIPMGRG